MEKLDSVLERLNTQRGPAIQFSTFLRDLADNETRWEKYGDSYSGNVVNMQIVAVENSLILLCSRLWDESKDSESIPNAFKLIFAHCPDILKRRMADIDYEFAENFEDRHQELRERIAENYENLKAKGVKNVLRILRTENLAHLVTASNDRKKLFPNGFEDHGVTRYQLYDFADASTKLVEEMRQLVFGEHADFEDSSAMFKGYCENYWNNLPVFKEAEG